MRFLSHIGAATRRLATAFRYLVGKLQVSDLGDDEVGGKGEDEDLRSPFRIKRRQLIDEYRGLELSVLQDLMPVAGGRIRTVEGALTESLYPSVHDWEILRGQERVETLTGSEEDARARMKALRESVYPPEVTFVDGNSSNAPEWQYRKLTGQKERDLLPLTQLRQLQIAYFLWTQNPLGYRLINIIRDFVVGDGFTFTAKDPRVKEVLDEFWNDPVNDWENKQDIRVLELSLYGEQILPVFVEQTSGRVRVGYIDPLQLVEVRTDPDNVEIARSLVLAQRLDSPTRKELRVIHVDTNPESRTFGRRVGDVFYFTVNKVSNATRGRSDLCPLLDWIDGYDQFMFNQQDRALLLQSFIWDVTLEGQNESQIQDWIKKQGNIPRPGSLRAHNEKVKWQAVSPSLDASESTELAKLLRMQILGGLGMADWMMGDGGGISKSTAGEMAGVAIKTFERRQKTVRAALHTIFEFVIDQAILHGRLPAEKSASNPDGINRGFTINAPRILERDTAQLVASLNTAANALAVAETNGWIDGDQAARGFAFMADQLGFNFTKEYEDKKRQAVEQGLPAEDAGERVVQQQRDENPPAIGTGSKAGMEVGPDDASRTSMPKRITSATREGMSWREMADRLHGETS